MKEAALGVRARRIVALSKCLSRKPADGGRWSQRATVIPLRGLQCSQPFNFRKLRHDAAHGMQRARQEHVVTADESHNFPGGLGKALIARVKQSLVLFTAPVSYSIGVL